MMENHHSSSGGGTSDLTLKPAGSPEPSSVSKSDQSIEHPPMFSKGGEPSCVSLKSDWSITEPPVFSRGREPSCVSMKSDRTIGDSPAKKKSTEPALQINTLVEETGDLHQDSYQPVDDVLHRVLQRHKTSMNNKHENLFEGIKSPENKNLLKRIYTQLYIIEGESEGVNEEHEVLQMEKTPRTHLQDSPINCSEIFKPLQGSEQDTEEQNIRTVRAKGVEQKSGEQLKVQKIRSVLTKGIAGIGKTVSVQKFILDWAEGKANQDVDFMFVLPFRELNLIKDDQYSLHGLLCDFHPELKDMDPQIYDQIKAVFIFDGLDESRIPLNFKAYKEVSDITMTSSVSVLMTNLITGDLLPSAFIWITSRPAAANQIPPEYINRVTEIQGFSDPQKEEYFRKRISDEDQAERIISHIKTARSLHIMCHIPVFCWISATVLQQIMKHHNTEIPTTLTEMYLHFLLTQINMKNEKYEEKDERDPEKLLESNRTILLKLAELAFKQLMEGNVMFYEEDLKESSIDITEASVYSGIFTEIFREECVLHQRKIYCFVHLSFQEFLAAVYVFHCYEINNMNDLQKLKPQYRDWSENVSLDKLLKGAVNKAVESHNGHLDLFLRFLLGISLESNQSLLQGLLTPTQSRSERTREYIKSLIKNNHNPISTERSINLFLCLSEMKDQSLSRELQEYLQSEKHSGVDLSPGQCSALVCMLLVSEEVLDELDLKKYNISKEGYRRLMPALTVCIKAQLSGWMVRYADCSSLASALKSNASHLRELYVSCENLEEPGVNLFSDLLVDPHCTLEKLQVQHGELIMIRQGLKIHFCELTLNPNTVSLGLRLSEGNRKVEGVSEWQPYLDDLERFDYCNQVLSVESLTGSCYWEVEWRGNVAIAVAYKGINRKGDRMESGFGYNSQSWSLNCCENSFSVRHNYQETALPAPPSPSNRVRVYLDWRSSTLSFYIVASMTGTLTHLHTLTTTFTEPLYAGFWIGEESSVRLCERQNRIVAKYIQG